MKERLVTLRIIPPIKGINKVKIELDMAQSTVGTVLSKLYESLGISQQTYNETLKSFVHIFYTRALVQNGRIIGWFGIEGLKPRELDLSVKVADELAIFFPGHGG